MTKDNAKKKLENLEFNLVDKKRICLKKCILL